MSFPLPIPVDWPAVEVDPTRVEAERERARRDASGLPDAIHDAILDLEDAGHASCCGDPVRLDLPSTHEARARLETAIRAHVGGARARPATSS